MTMDQEYYRVRAGHLDQIAYAKKLVMTEGKADGMRIVDIDNGGGLRCTLLESRCLDIAKLSYKGVNLGFVAKPCFVTPSQCSVVPGEFTRYFHGGMLYTCGLQNIGPEHHDENGGYPLHGRLGMTPAEEVGVKVDWDAKEIIVTGQVSLAALFGSNLVLKRKIRIPIFESSIEIVDTVVNIGFKDENIMLLYHFNFGWPMLAENTRLEIMHDRIEPRDETAQRGIDEWNRFEHPIAGKREQVFYHTPICEKDNLAHARVVNDDLKICAEISFDPQMLPELIEWKSMASGDYALGIEPSTSRVNGKEKEEQAGRIVVLGAGEKKTYKVTLQITST